jgi:hypothetical protein
MLEAHVQFELDRWRGERLDETLRAEVDAVLDWLQTARLADLAPPDTTPLAVAALVDELPVTDELLDLVAEVAVAVDEAVRGQDATLGDLVTSEDVDGLVDVLAGMDDARSEVLSALTESEAYTRLVAHVLYHGLKAYALTENVFARKIPGASSLVRLGQRGLSSAAPRLEANVDRQLTAFVQANIADTLRESRRYLDATLDEQMLRTTAQDLWESLSTRTLGQVAEPVAPQDVGALTLLGGHAYRRAVDSGVVAAVVAQVLGALLERHGERAVGEVLDDLGITPDLLAEHVTALLRPGFAHAETTGLLEDRLRAHLGPFYAALPHLLPGVGLTDAAPASAAQ